MKSGEPEKPIKELMADCTEVTIKNFEFEYQLIRTIAGVNIELFVLVSEHVIKKNLQFAILSLAIKNFRLLQCIDDCIFNGYYEVSTSLMRILYDNLLLMEYLLNHEKEVDRWMYGTKKISSRNIRKTLKRNKKLYDFLSNYFIHANIESIIPIIESIERADNDTNTLLSYVLYPKYDEKKAEYNIHLSILLSWLNNLHLQYVFKDYLWENEEWKKQFIDWNEVWIVFLEEKILKKSDIKFEFKHKLPS